MIREMNGVHQEGCKIKYLWEPRNIYSFSRGEPGLLMKHSGIHTEQIPSQVTEHTVAFIEFQHIPVNLTAENCQPGLHVKDNSFVEAFFFIWQRICRNDEGYAFFTNSI